MGRGGEDLAVVGVHVVAPWADEEGEGRGRAEGVVLGGVPLEPGIGAPAEHVEDERRRVK